MADYSKINHLKDLNNSMFNERMNRAYDYGYEDGLARGTECGYKRGYENGKKSKQTDKERLSRMTNQEASKIIKDGLEDMSLDFADEEQYEALEMAIKALEQEPKTGHWNYTDAYPHWVCCDRCKTRFIPNKEWIKAYNIPTNYCPNCGCRMEE